MAFNNTAQHSASVILLRFYTPFYCHLSISDRLLLLIVGADFGLVLCFRMRLALSGFTEVLSFYRWFQALFGLGVLEIYLLFLTLS
jgi:hypothetical protein